VILLVLMEHVPKISLKKTRRTIFGVVSLNACVGNTLTMGSKVNVLKTLVWKVPCSKTGGLELGLFIPEREEDSLQKHILKGHILT